jgi:signal transduction histidine kinase
VRLPSLSRDRRAADSALRRTATGLVAGALAIAGGHLELDSPPGGGTRIAVTLPLRR